MTTYLTPTKNHWILDAETDGLRDEATKVFVVCVENAITDEAYSFTSMEELRQWIEEHPDAIFVGHNIIGFDCPVLNALAGTRIGIKRVVDTMVLSMLYSPNLLGGHSLGDWGQRVKLPKFVHKDFTQFSPEMERYCKRDVAITKLVFSRLGKRMREVGFTEKSAEIEHLSWHIIQNKQRRRGFPFNRIEAEKLYSHLRQREEELKDEIYRLWPPIFGVVRTFKGARKKDGNYSKQYLRHLEQYPELREIDGGGYEALDWIKFDLGSPSQRVEKLLSLGWKPVKFTKKTEKGGGGNPKVDEDSLIDFANESNTPEVKALATWVVTNSRANMIRNWLNSYNEKTGAIHGYLKLANTLRYSHDHPNSANIPAVRLDKNEAVIRGEAGGWSYESRDLWWCGSDSYCLVGIDAKGIQLRVLANYLDDPTFTANILSADPHSANQKAWGFKEGKEGRALAKTIVYATLMGAGDARISVEAKVSLDEAKAAKKIFFDQVPGLPDLIDRLKYEFRRTGRIGLCDGSRILVPRDYMVIPYLLQGDESRIMRQAAIYVDAEVRRHKLDATKVGDIHDEWQNVVHRRDCDRYIELALGAFPRAGLAMSYRVPIEGDAKVGRTWAETH